MSKQYKNSKGEYFNNEVTLNGLRIINPTHEQILQAGYEEIIFIPTLDDIKKEKIEEIKIHDKSTENFSFNGIDLWINPTQRQDILRFLNAVTAQGLTQESEIEYPYEGMNIKAKVKDIYSLVYAIDYYAAVCMATTNKHIAAVKALTTAEEVRNYDYTTGYPEKLTINI